MQTFTAHIKKVWIMRCVDVPAAVVRALGGGRRIPVLAHYLGETLENTVVPSGRGRGRLTLRMDLLRPAGLDAGDRIEVSLEADAASREPEMPADLRRALAFRPAAREKWERETAAMRRQLVLYLEKARRAETREKRVEQIVERLAEGTAGQ